MIKNPTETLNLSTDVDSSTDMFATAGVKKGADRVFFFAPPPKKNPSGPTRWSSRIQFFFGGSPLKCFLGGYPPINY